MDAKSISAADFMAASDELLIEIIRQAEARLDAQCEIARAVDQRATAWAGISGALGAVLMAHAFGNWAAQEASAWIAALAGSAMLVAMLSAILASRPAGLFVVGNSPESWIGDIKGENSLHRARAETAAIYSRHIDANDQRLGKRARLLRLAMLFVFLSPLVGGAAGLIHALLA